MGWTALSGYMTMPCSCGDAVLGGHAVLAVGYDDEKQVFIVRNSWSEWWETRATSTCPTLLSSTTSGVPTSGRSAGSKISSSLTTAAVGRPLLLLRTASAPGRRRRSDEGVQSHARCSGA